MTDFLNTFHGSAKLSAVVNTCLSRTFKLSLRVKQLTIVLLGEDVRLALVMNKNNKTEGRK